MPAIVACVATFRPADLRALISAVRPQVEAVIVADDASPVTYDSVLRDAASIADEVLRHHRNAGIARGLNAGLASARARGAEWLLTLDQDSLPRDGYVDALARALDAARGRGLNVGAVGASLFRGSGGVLAIPTRRLTDDAEVADELVLAGTLWNVEALGAIGGFDETLGMDAVDAAAGIRLRRSGCSLLVVPGLELRHEIGRSRPVRLLGRTVQATSHSPERRETILRNRLKLAPEAARVSIPYSIRTVRRAAIGAVLAATVEEDRWEKTKGSLRGLLPKRGK